MHVVNDILVNDVLIEYAEKILLPQGNHFNQERRDFISDFETLDLKAVPGSGKTTLLLAKLIVIEKSLPLMDGKSILVLSHTNTAVNEINSKIKDFCPKLFTYPNHVGTIQSFVNKYLAIPYFESVTGKKVISIDDESYYKYVEHKYSTMQNFRLKEWLSRQHDPSELLKKMRFNNEGKLVNYINGIPDDFPLKDTSSSSYKGLVSFKVSIMNQGILHYDDAYYLANKYIERHPSIKDIIRKRFGYVFVDEMQDMDIHQYKLLEDLFESDQVCYQRLGDNNQAIYNNIVHSNNIWATRSHTRNINGSYRLSKYNAEIASRFGIDNINIEGLNINSKEQKPILLVFKDEHIECKVVQAFSDYISRKIKEEPTVVSNINIYKVLSWRKNNDSGHLSLQKYCPDYVNQRNDTNLDTEKDVPIQTVVKEIIAYLGDICFNENVTFKGMVICKDNIRKMLLDDQENLIPFERYVYFLTIYIISRKKEDFNSEFCGFLCFALKALGVLDIDIERLRSKYKSNFEYFLQNQVENLEKCIKCSIGNCSPTMGTVHSVKGETHDVTLFLESYYKDKYESDVLFEVLCGQVSVSQLIVKEINKISILEDEISKIQEAGKDRGIKTRNINIEKCKRTIMNIQQYSKLVYVALTRAKSIIGYGISKAQYEKYFIQEINPAIWDIIFIEEFEA
jgi:hypothetical protein